MRQLLLLLLPLPAAMGMGMVVRLPFCLRVPVESEVGVMTVRVSVVMIMPVRRRRIGRLFKPALFADFLGPSNGVVERVALARGVRGKTFDRILVHVAGQRDLRVLHAQRSWVTRVLARGRHRVIGFPAHAMRNGKRGDDPGSLSATVRTGFFRLCLTQGTEFFKDDVTGRAVVFVEWHADTSPLLNGGWRVGQLIPVFRVVRDPDRTLVQIPNGPQALDGQRRGRGVGVQRHPGQGVELFAQMEGVADQENGTIRQTHMQ